jgi:hypothetical protein
MGRLYAAARLYVNFFQPSFKLKERQNLLYRATNYGVRGFVDPQAPLEH